MTSVRRAPSFATEADSEMQTIFLLAAAASVLYLRWPDPTHAQSYDNVNDNYRPMTFDAELRGSYNISYCVKAKMNCWEIAKPEVYCRNEEMWTTICDLLNEYCTNVYDDLADYSNVLEVQESWCDNRNLYTK